MVNRWSISIVVKILNTCSTGLLEEDIVIASSANKAIYGNSLLRCTKILSHVSWYSRWINNALIVVWSYSHSAYTFYSSKPVTCKGLVKCQMRVLISFKPFIERSVIQNWGSSHIDKQDISSLNEPSLYWTSAMKISMEVDLRVKAELSDSRLRVASLKELISISMYSLFSSFPLSWPALV